jgi:hypothetical protein
MPDRAIIPFTVAIMGGFFCGLLCSVLQLQSGPTLAIAIAGAVASVLAALASVVGCEGDRRDVAILRVFYAVLLFLAVDFALVSFLRDAHGFAALVLLLVAALAAGMLATPRVQSEPRGDERNRARPPAQPTT